MPLWRRALYPAVVFTIFGVSIAGFAVAQLVAGGIPQVPQPGWVEVLARDAHPSFATVTARFDARGQRVRYSLNACDRPAPGNELAPGRTMHGVILLHGNARVDAAGATGNGDFGPQSLNGQRVVAVTFTGSELTLPSDVEVFRFSVDVPKCLFGSATAPAFIGKGPVILDGRLTEPVRYQFAFGGLRGPHEILEWPSLGVLDWFLVRVPGLAGDPGFGNTFKSVAETYEVDGGTLDANQETEDVRPDPTDIRTLRFVGERGITPLVRFQDVSSLRRWQALSTFMTVVFGLVTAFIGALAFELWRDARQRHRSSGGRKAID